jgi:hypothetical protein
LISKYGYSPLCIMVFFIEIRALTPTALILILHNVKV